MRRLALMILILSLSLTTFAWGAEKKVVRIWHTETEPQTVAAFKQIINDFEKLNPDISVKQEALAWSYMEKMARYAIFLL